MPAIEYVPKTFKPEKIDLIKKVNNIIGEYEIQGYSLTLRQVYYQLVARDVIPNNERSYKNLGVLINDARLAGLIDWEAIVDRTRFLRRISYWNDPLILLRSAANQFSINPWTDMDTYCEIWVEKDALIDIVEQASQHRGVNCLSCRGYVSQSTMWEAAQRLINKADKKITIFHLGDHDPSGIDMSRDMGDRLELFGADVEFKRIALNWDQVRSYSPPPNPTKLTDSRSSTYIDQFGYECWELDALEPAIISDLIDESILSVMDMDVYDAVQSREAHIKSLMKDFVETYPQFCSSEGDSK